jgi:GNAT superfamily N-acetyltransferase
METAERSTDAAAGDALLFRRATRKDIPHLVRLLADDPLGSRRERFADPLPDAYYAAFEELNADPNSEVVVVERDGEIVGTFQLTFIRGLTHMGAARAQVEAVRVDARSRGLGIGARMFEWAVGRARERGCRMVQLTTHVERPDARRFYERLGFVASHVGMKLDLAGGSE